ncbi:hypothetical protein LIER_02823 [Lithospermum erythrorhizon]|uniref:Amino acid transporter transmembrane domain-containing protein n=1 Tax=Lithospermum erythrorhizon TaxID=34254 RepID=A0AAV3NRB3_LITER
MRNMPEQNFQFEINEIGMEIHQKIDEDEGLDDDGKPKRTGTVWTASAHIVTAIIGSGVLSLGWGVAQLGWIGGVTTLAVFSAITVYTSGLLADCYRAPLTGKRNYSYMEAVKNNLGGKKYKACGMVQYANLCGMIIGYTITASISMAAVEKSNCFHKRGRNFPCSASHNPYMIGLGIIEIFLSQIPNFHQLSWLSVVAAFMSFGYSSIGFGLGLAKVVSGETARTSLTGIETGEDTSEKTWKMFRALGNIAFAYTFSQVLVDIQDTLKSSPPENKVMRKANVIGLSVATSFYMMCGCFGYAAFGKDTPDNLLTGFGFYEPFWLVDMANLFIVIHLVGAYQVFIQPVFSAFEQWARSKWPDSDFVMGEHHVEICPLRINFLRLTWRTAFVILATLVAMIMPFFNSVLAFLGALGYWPLTVYFPIEMYIAKKKIPKWSCRWLGLELINLVCLIVALAAACGSIQGLSKALSIYEPFKVKE